MSKKYQLTQDNEDDSVWSSIKRHLRTILLLIVVPLVALIALVSISAMASVRQSVINERSREIAAMTRAAMPTSTPRPTRTPLPPSSIGNQTLLRSGPGLDFGRIRTMDIYEPVTLAARDRTGQWYMLDNGGWVAATAIVGEIPDLPIRP